MSGPDGKPVHAELTLRGTTLMLGPESEPMERCSAKSVGASPATLYICCRAHQPDALDQR
jgi:uncharacterized glyoxalase superfamily protein PhnB